MSEVTLEEAFEAFRRQHPPGAVERMLHRFETIIQSDKATKKPTIPEKSNPPGQRSNSSNHITNPAEARRDPSWDDLGRMEDEAFSDGYSCIPLQIPRQEMGGQKIHRGRVQHQCFSLDNAMIQVTDAEDTPETLTDESPFVVPHFDCTRWTQDYSNLESLMEEKLRELAMSEAPQRYLMKAAHTSKMREQLGLPETSLSAGTRLLTTITHYPGIHSPYAYVSAGVSVFALHVEDFFLKSANLVYAGAPKLWVIIHPMYIHKLEAKLAEQLQIKPKCTQFLRHKPILPFPSLLNQWRIKYSMVLQHPGSLMLIESSAYHYGLNLGPNIAEAVNYCDEDWMVPPTYRDCLKKLGCGDTEHMTMTLMKMGEIRPLDVVDCDELEAVQPKPSKERSSKDSSHDQLVKTTAPKTTTPEAIRPETIAPETTTPQTTAPEAIRTETTAPETIASETMVLRPRKPITAQETHNTSAKPITASRKKSARKKALTRQSAKLTVQEAEATPDVQVTTRGSPAEESADDDEAPSYQPDDLVGQIQWWIWFIIKHDGHSSSHPLLGGFEDVAEMRVHLETLIPDQDPIEKSQLSDRVVFGLLEHMFDSVDNAHVVDPVILIDALEKVDASDLDLKYEEATTLIIPHCHQADQWCLIVVDVNKKQIDVYDTDDHASDLILQLIKKCLPGAEEEWVRRFEQLFPGVSDTSNSGIYTIACAESILGSDEIRSYSPTKLRQRYIRKIAKPLEEDIYYKAGLKITDRRQTEPMYNRVTGHRNKRIKLLPLSNSGCGPVEEVGTFGGEGDLAVVNGLGEDWGKFYEKWIAEGIPTTRMYLILGLVSAVGCPQVMADLIDIARQAEMSPATNHTEAALKLYTAAETNLIRSQLKMRYAAVFMHCRFVELNMWFRKDKGRKKLERRKEARRGGKVEADQGNRISTRRGDSYALDQLTAEAYSISVSTLLKIPIRQNYKDRIRKIKAEGKVAYQFDEECGTRLWNLIPAREMTSPMDPNLRIKPSMYTDLSKDEVQLLKRALQELRPRLHHLVHTASLINGILLESERDESRLEKLQQIDSESMMEEKLDSDRLLCLLEL